MRAMLLFLAGMISGIMLVASGVMPLSFGTDRLVLAEQEQQSVPWRVRLAVNRGVRVPASAQVLRTDVPASAVLPDNSSAAGPAAVSVQPLHGAGAETSPFPVGVRALPESATSPTPVSDVPEKAVVSPEPGAADLHTVPFANASDHVVPVSQSAPPVAAADGNNQTLHSSAEVLIASEHVLSGNATADTTVPLPAPAPETTLPMAPASVQAQYEQALRAYEAGTLALSRRLFARFMDSHPHHALLPNALYWTGETWYDQHRFDTAEQIFQQVVRLYPRHHKSADALLKMAYCAERRGDVVGARILLHRLLAAYPKSDASRLGRQVMKKMQGRRNMSGQVIARG